MSYLNDELIPILSDCAKRDRSLVTSMYLTLTINQKGNVIDVDFRRIDASEACKNELSKNLLSMNGWTPGKVSGEYVCTEYHWPISCILWEE